MEDSRFYKLISLGSSEFLSDEEHYQKEDDDSMLDLLRLIKSERWRSVKKKENNSFIIKKAIDKIEGIAITFSEKANGGVKIVGGGGCANNFVSWKNMTSKQHHTDCCCRRTQ